MARIEYADVADAPQDVAESIERMKAIRGGELVNIYRMLLHSPSIADAWNDLARLARQPSSMDRRTSELAICLVATLLDSEYEKAHHLHKAISAGVRQEQLDALSSWRSSDQFDDRERALLQFTEEVTVTGRASQEAFDALRPYFDNRQLVEFTVVLGFYGMVARFLETLQVDIEAS